MEAQTDVMCAVCGDTTRQEQGRMPSALGPLCTSCTWHVGDERRFVESDGRRDYCTSWLLGDGFGQAPVGMGQRLGLQFACEVEGFTGGRGPWRHLDWRRSRERATAEGIAVFPLTARW